MRTSVQRSTLLRFQTRTFHLKTERGVSRARLARDRQSIETDEWGALAVEDCIPEGCWSSPAVIAQQLEAKRSDIAFLANAGVRVNLIPPAPLWLQTLVEASGAIVYGVESGFRTVSVYLPDSGCFLTAKPRGLADFLRRPTKAQGLVRRVEAMNQPKALRGGVEPYLSLSGGYGLGVAVE